MMTVSLEMILPGLAGLWIDSRLGTKVVFALIGFAVGMSSAIWHLLRMTSRIPRRKGEASNSERADTEGQSDR